MKMLDDPSSKRVLSRTMNKKKDWKTLPLGYYPLRSGLRGRVKNPLLTYSNWVTLPPK
jgi:hypothetical protein